MTAIAFKDERLKKAQGLVTENRIGDAVGLIKAALGENPKNDQAVYLLACAAKQAGDASSAMSFYTQALQLAPEQEQYALDAAQAYVDAKKFEAAVEILLEARKRFPDSFVLRQRLALAQGMNNNIEEAINLFTQLLKEKPDDVMCLSGYAVVAEMANDLDAAEKSAARVLELKPKDNVARVAFAKVLRRNKKLDEARTQLERVVAEEKDRTVLSEARLELGRTLDKLGEYDAAFAAFEQAQNVFEELYQKPEGQPNLFNLSVEGALQWFEDAARTKNWHYSPAENEPAPVFLVGFPRSGTTLTEQILSAHPKMVGTQEESFVFSLMVAMQKLLPDAGGYPQVMEGLDDDMIRQLRAYYWQSVQAVCGFDPARDVVVDKMPVNMAHLGIIKRVFPDAKVIMCIRDPRDVCLSCFQQGFEDNDAMANFFSLTSTAQTYDKLFTLYSLYKDTLGLDILEMKYEDLVANQEATSRKMIEHIGLEWDDAVLNYHAKDKNRFVITPSYEGVMQPIYTSAMEKWRNYEGHFGDNLATLSPWVDRLGYKNP